MPPLLYPKSKILIALYFNKRLNTMGTIAIEGMQFYAYHGYYKEERKKGNYFMVDVYLDLDFAKAGQDDAIQHTVNYEKVYAVCVRRMQKTHKLLETVCVQIAEQLHRKYPEVKKTRVRISKLHPPLSGPSQRFYVEHSIKRKMSKHKDLSF